jgi:hypothetical protein
MSKWSLIFDNVLTFNTRSEESIIDSLNSSHLVYEAAYNSPLPRVGTLIHSESLAELDWTVIDRYPISRGKRLLELSPGVNDQYKLSFVPSVEPCFSLVVTLKLWVPTMPLSRVGASVTVTPLTSASVNASSVAAEDEPVVILAANSNRKGASIINASTATLYIELGASVSSTDYVVDLHQGDYYEVPFGYVGLIMGVWSEQVGNAYVREFV